MRILIMGGPYLGAALRAAGHEVVACGHFAGADLELNHPVSCAGLLRALGSFQPDLFCYLDDGNLPLLVDPEAVPCPAVYYSIDTYCNPWHFGYAHGFDLTLVAQKDFVPLFAAEKLDARWFPLFGRMTEFCPGSDFARRDIPVAFVGTLGHKNNPDREPFLRQFRKLQPLVLLHGDYRPVFARSRIVLNQTAFAELNFRCFEAMQAGCALLMEDCGNGLRDIFRPGENILPVYPRGDARAAAEIARAWLAMPDKLADLAVAGAEFVRREHSDVARAARLSALALPLLAQEPRKRLADARRPFVRAAFGMIAAELTNPAMASHRDFYHSLAIDNLERGLDG